MLEKIKPYYSHAKRVALLAQDNLTKKWYHIFSVVELLPPDILPYDIPTKEWFEKRIVRAKQSSNSDMYSIYLMISDLTIDDALRILQYPFENTLIDGQHNYFLNSAFTKEPTGTSPFVIPSNVFETDTLGSVLPKRNSGALVWVLIDNERMVQKTFQTETISKEMKCMSQLTLDWLGFDIWSRPEHIGNIYLSAPNPYLRDIDISLSRNPIGIMYEIKMRRNVKQKLTIGVIDKHGDTITLDKRFPINSHVGILELPHEPHLVELRVYDSDGDLIALERPATFIKSIRTEMNIKQADYHVKVQSIEGEREFVVEKFSRDKPSQIGVSTDFNAPYFFKDAENKRKHEQHKKSKQFMFFPGGKTPEEIVELKSQTKTIIRDIINLSNETCYLCDPYFNANDLIEYAFYIKNSSAKIRILNCKEDISKENAAALLEALSQYNKAPFANIECKMLRGRSILHDRFIIADTSVWYLGSSFSEFGSRATCIGKVPESSNVQIVKEVEKWFFNSGDDYTQSLEEYVNS